MIMNYELTSSQLDNDEINLSQTHLDIWNAHEIKSKYCTGDEFVPYKFIQYATRVKMNRDDYLLMKQALEQIYQKADNNWKVIFVPAFLKTRCTHMKWYSEQLSSCEYVSTTSSYVCVKYTDRKTSYYHPCQIEYFFEIDIVCQKIGVDTTDTRTSNHIFAKVKWFKNVHGKNHTWLFNQFQEPTVDDFVPLQRIYCRFAPYIFNVNGENMMKLCIISPRLF